MVNLVYFKGPAQVAGLESEIYITSPFKGALHGWVRQLVDAELSVGTMPTLHAQILDVQNLNRISRVGLQQNCKLVHPGIKCTKFLLTQNQVLNLTDIWYSYSLYSLPYFQQIG
jgi:hypothetical protein